MKLASLNTQTLLGLSAIPDHAQVDLTSVDTTACVPYKESLRDEFIRLTSYFKTGSFNQVVDVPKLPNTDTALKIYGLTQQAQFGDNNTEKPSFYQFTAKKKWDAWEAEKGKSRDQSKQEFIDLGLQMLSDINIDTTDPKEAAGDVAYQKCIDDAKA